MASVDEIQAILNRKLLQKLYMAVERRLYLRPTAFHIFVTEYNAGVYLEKCLGSIASQKTTIPYYAYVVDDAPRGIQAAHQAGVIPIAVATGVYSRQELEKSNPRRIIDSLTELL